MKEGWTVQIFPRDGGRSRSFRIPRRGVRIGALALAVLLGLVAVWGTLFVRDVDRAAELTRLRAENQRLQSDLRNAEERTDALTRSLDVLAQREERFRLMAGLPLIDPDVREVGVGGPSTQPPRTRSEAVTQQLDQLHRRARLLNSSLAEATDSMEVHRDVFLSRPSIRPVATEDAWISASYSHSRRHPVLLNNRPHTGIDISAHHGDPILATARGTVTYVGRIPGYGKLVELDHGYGYRTRYAHASRILVRRGEQVERGDVIAEVGDTGISTGPHVHYEVLVDGRPVDPHPFFLDDRLAQ